MDSASDLLVYEVFRQTDTDPAIQWVGTVRAMDPFLAWHSAKEVYGRRENCLVLWVAPRSCFVRSEPDDRTVLESGVRMEYRQSKYPSSHRRERQRDTRASDSDGGGEL